MVVRVSPLYASALVLDVFAALLDVLVIVAMSPFRKLTSEVVMDIPVTIPGVLLATMTALRPLNPPCPSDMLFDDTSSSITDTGGMYPYPYPGSIRNMLDMLPTVVLENVRALVSVELMFAAARDAVSVVLLEPPVANVAPVLKITFFTELIKS